MNYDEIVSPLPHPGEILREEFMIPLGITAGKLAKAMGVERTRIERLSRCTQAVSADTALRLGKVTGTTPEFWLNLQNAHDLSAAALSAREELLGLKSLRTP